MLKSLTSAELPGVDNVDEVVKELEKGIELTQETTKGSLKISKVMYSDCIHVINL